MCLVALRHCIRQMAYVFLGAFLIGFVAAMITRIYVGREYARGLQTIRDAGMPVTLAELSDQYVAQCPSKEALSHYERAFALMGDTSTLGEIAELDDTAVRELPPMELQKFHDFVEAHTEAISNLEAATRFPCAWFPLEQVEVGIAPDQVRDIDTMVPARCRETIRLLRLAALDALAHQDPDQATRHVMSLIGLSDHLLCVPVFAGSTLAQFSVSVANDLVVEGMRRGQWRLADVEAIGNRLTRVEAALYAARNEAGDFAVYRHLVSPEMSYAEIGGGVLSIVARMDDIDITAVGDVLPGLLSGIGVVAAYARLQDLLVLDLVRDEIARLQEPLNSPFAESEPVPKFTFTPKYQSLVKVKVLLTACAIEAHRLKHAACPDSLEVLDETWRAWLRNNPFTGLPMHYQRDADGFVLKCLSRASDDVEDPCEGRHWCEDVELKIP